MPDITEHDARNGYPSLSDSHHGAPLLPTIVTSPVLHNLAAGMLPLPSYTASTRQMGGTRVEFDRPHHHQHPPRLSQTSEKSRTGCVSVWGTTRPSGLTRWASSMGRFGSDRCWAPLFSPRGRAVASGPQKKHARDAYIKLMRAVMYAHVCRPVDAGTGRGCLPSGRHSSRFPASTHQCKSAR